MNKVHTVSKLYHVLIKSTLVAVVFCGEDSQVFHPNKHEVLTGADHQHDVHVSSIRRVPFDKMETTS